MSTKIKDVVKEKYGEAALRVLSGSSSCCETSSPYSAESDPITSHLYNEAQAIQIPKKALKASLRCGNPTALAMLNQDDTVLNLKSSDRIDVLLSARRVGPTGKVY